MKLLGKFESYTPKNPPLPTANYLKNGEGIDWYSISHDAERVSKNIYLLVDDGGNVSCATDRGEMLFPSGLNVYEMPKEDAPAGLVDKFDWVLKEGELIAPDTLVMDAMAKKGALIATTEKAIEQLSRAVRLKMATDTEKSQLENWEKYSVLLSRIDVSAAPDIEWPEAPRQA
ncbi:tail fiber assembly protein [Ewingella americana]|uniref:tail fiber assembly protein n=1 Tax=Ewingella americana TaxID=41202 RepID=UPI0012AE946A|nr:tail fiber assembly protein [Ewingella americana]MRT03172.1 hypothetical protein [Ewingella americana]